MSNDLDNLLPHVKIQIERLRSLIKADPANSDFYRRQMNEVKYETGNQLSNEEVLKKSEEKREDKREVNIRRFKKLLETLSVKNILSLLEKKVSYEEMKMLKRYKKDDLIKRAVVILTPDDLKDIK